MNSKISKEDIKKLSNLARIEIPEEEMEKLGGEIDSILSYLAQVKEVGGEYKEEVEIGPLINVWREDVDPTESGTYSKEIIAEFPQSEENFLKVKKIL